MQPRASEQLKGRGIGGIFLSFFGALWMVAALNQQPISWLFACDALPASLLLFRSIGLIAAGRRMRQNEPPLSPEELALGKITGRRFAWIFGAEGVAIFLAANLLTHFGYGDYIIAVAAIIVGLHFLPLARLFHYPLYYATGIVEVVLCTGVLLAFRAHPEALVPLIGIIMALTLWITVVAVLVRSRSLAASPGAA